MTDYKLVPVEPTLDMLCEGMDVYGSEDYAEADVLGIYKAMLAAAPAVQGEPVSYQCRPAGSPHWSECSKGEHDHLKSGKPSMDGVKREARALYTTPQPAVKGEPVVEPVVEPFAWVAVSPCGEMSEMQSTEQCARDLADDWNKELHTLHPGPACHVQPLYTAPQPVEQQPAPDVALLVEALECAIDRLEGAGLYYSAATVRCRKALAAHRKGGEV